MTESSADREEHLAVLQEDTEQRMHSVAGALPNPERVHERASQLSDRAAQHQRRAEQLREDLDKATVAKSDSTEPAES